MKTKEQMIDAIENNVYTTQKDLGLIIGESAQNVSRLIGAYNLKDLYLAHRAEKVKAQEPKEPGKYDKWFQQCRDMTQRFWPEYLEQNGEKHEEDIKHDYKYGITDRVVTIRYNILNEHGKEVILNALFLRKFFEEMTDEEKIIIGGAIEKQKVIFVNREFGFGLKDGGTNL